MALLRCCLLSLLNCLLICVTFSLSSGEPAKSYRRPNIVLILTDDLDVANGGLVGKKIIQPLISSVLLCLELYFCTVLLELAAFLVQHII